MISRKNQNQLRSLYLFSFFSLLGASVYGLYYGIFLYRHSFNINVLIVDSLLVVISGWFGYLLGSHIIQDKGYSKTIKASFLLLLFTSLITLFIANNIHIYYPVLSIFRGLSAGIFTSVIDVYLLRELSSNKRGKYLSLSLSFEFIISVIVPFLIGSLITVTHGYNYVFILSALIYFATLFIPSRINNKPKGKVILTPKSSILKKDGFWEFNINTAISNGADQLNCLLYAIIPFLIFGSEFKVGSFSSFIAIIAAVTALATRNMRYKKQIKLGYVGNGGRLLSNIYLCFSWTPFALFVQGIINKAMSPLNDPIFQKVRLSNSTNILGSDLKTKSLQMNFMNATMGLIGKSIALVIFMLFLAHNQDDPTAVLKTLLIIYGVWKMANYLWMLNMKQRLSNKNTEKVPAIEEPAI